MPAVAGMSDIYQSEGFPRTGYLFPARDGLWPGLKKEVLLARRRRRRRRRRRHLGLGHFKKIRNVVFPENKKCCLQSEQRELIQCYSNLKKGGYPQKWILNCNYKIKIMFCRKHEMISRPIRSLWLRHFGKYM